MILVSKKEDFTDNIKSQIFILHQTSIIWDLIKDIVFWGFRKWYEDFPFILLQIQWS